LGQYRAKRRKTSEARRSASRYTETNTGRPFRSMQMPMTRIDSRTLRIALGVFAVAIVVLAKVGRPTEYSAFAQSPMDVSHHHAGAPASPSTPVESTFYSEMMTVNARMHEAMEIIPSGNVDRDFMRMMIPHHQGAIDMAVVVLKHGRDERLRRLAQSIIVEQGQEIAYMRALLDAPPATASTAHSIP
jgi:Domain of unknown function (DUF305)